MRTADGCAVNLRFLAQELAGGWKEILEPLVNWSALGCDKGAADSTVWLGSEGSHTPLHHDTYGVNMVRPDFDAVFGARSASS